MKSDVDILGIHLPGLLVVMLIGFVIARLLWAVLARTGFYALVWHRALFNMALYVLIVGALVWFLDRSSPL